MKRFKTTVLLLLALIMITGLLSGCHGAKKSASFIVPEEFDTSRNYNITFWAKNDTNKFQTDIYQKAIDDFEALYPNITVTMRLYTDYSKIYNDVITNIATETTPNVCITYPDHIATYKTGTNVVVPLDELFTNEKYGLGGSELRFDGPTVKDIVPEFLEECKLGDAYYALPYMRSTEACYINKDMVEALGYKVPDVLTWDYIWEVSEAATKKDADGNYVINGQKVLIPFIYKSTDNMMITMLKQLNAGYSDEAGNIYIFNDDTKEILNTVAAHTATGAFSTFKISGYPANFLNAGQCIFAIDSTAGATWMGSDAPNSDISPDKFIRFNTVVRTVPQYDPQNQKMISQGPSLCVFNKEDPQIVIASWLFAQYLLTNDVQISYSETEGYIPVTTKAQKAPEYVQYLADCGKDTSTHYEVKIQAAKLLIDHVSDTFVTPVFNGSTSLRDAAGQMIENVTKSVRRKEKIDDKYIEQMYDDVTSLYRLDQLNASGGSSRADLGPLPGTAITLLVVLGIVWLIIIAYLIYGQIKKRTNK